MANSSKATQTRPTANRIVVDRSSVTGRFVTPEYAQRHPRTTEQERYRIPKR